MNTNTFNFTDWIPIGISSISLLISLINFIRDWKRISLSISKKMIIKRVETYDAEEVFPNQIPGLGIEFRFINPSKHSIGYFDMVFRDGYTNELLPAYFKYALRPEIASQEMLGITYNDQVVHLNFMNSNYGSIPSNSYVLKETIVIPSSDKIRVNIKFAQFSLIPNFRSQISRFKKHKSVLLKISTEELAIFQNLAEQLNKGNQKSGKC